MLNEILFLRALLTHVDRLQDLLGEDWPELRERFDALLHELLSEPNEKALPARANRIYRWLSQTPAETLVRTLFRQASELARRLPPDTRNVSFTDLTTGERRSADLWVPGLSPDTLDQGLAASAEELAAAARELVQVLASSTTATKTAEHPAPTAETTLRKAYPDIAVNDAHLLAGCPVNFTVTLAANQSADTTGRVLLPDSDPHLEHALQVHLLFGGSSAWDTLIYSAAGGSSKAASFSLLAPTISGERELIEVRANFYLNQRWCGEGQRHLDVRRDAAVAPLANIPPPPVPPWRRALLLQPAALPSDLIVRIQKGAMPGEFLWSCLSPHLDLPPPADTRDARMSLGEDAATFVRRTFAPLAGKTLDRLSIADVCGAGEKIYCNTPPHFRNCYWAVWNAAAADGFRFVSVQIITDEPCVPWELMRLRDPERAPGVAAEFLGIRHSVGRWLASESAAMRQSITVRKVAVAASDYQNVAAISGKLHWAARERELMVGTYHADSVPLRSDAVLDFLEDGRVQAVHFACHGEMSVSDPDASLLVMEDTPNDLKPLAVARSEVCDGLGSEHPLVFLNACEVGGAAASLSLIAGFPAAFLYAGAALLVSPLWAVNDAHACTIAEEFYSEVFAAPGGKTMGEVLRDLRQRWKDEKHLTFLAYVLYGDPLARVEYRPSP